ncbi:MAG: hypothetical protein ACR2NZ_18630 [Rubripirellula sp.]
MPLGHARSDVSRTDRTIGDGVWGMPLGRIGRLRLSLSYTVFFALAILVLVVLNVSRQPGNADLPRAALWGTVFWLSGWLVQGVVYYWVARMLGRRMSVLTIGLLGVETSPVRWPARNALIVSIATLTSLLVLGGFYRLVEGGFQMPVLSQPGEPIWKLPSIGLGKLDSIWQTATWLCFVQVLGQLYPLPRSLGRQIFAALASTCGRKLDPTSKASLFRRCLDSVAVVSLLFAIWMLMADQDVAGAEWPFFLVLSLLLWISTRNSDAVQVMEGFQVEQGIPPQADVIQEVREVVRRRQGWRRLKRAHRMEQGEAVDAERLDEILNRLHREGIESLNTADRRILERVSENLRKQRESDPPEPGTTG